MLPFRHFMPQALLSPTLCSSDALTPPSFAIPKSLVSTSPPRPSPLPSQPLPSLHVSMRITPSTGSLRRFLLRLDVDNRSKDRPIALRQVSSDSREWRLLPLEGERGGGVGERERGDGDGGGGGGAGEGDMEEQGHKSSAVFPTAVLGAGQGMSLFLHLEVRGWCEVVICSTENGYNGYHMSDQRGWCEVVVTAQRVSLNSAGRGRLVGESVRLEGALMVSQEVCDH